MPKKRERKRIVLINGRIFKLPSEGWDRFQHTSVNVSGAGNAIDIFGKRLNPGKYRLILERI